MDWFLEIIKIYNSITSIIVNSLINVCLHVIILHMILYNYLFTLVFYTGSILSSLTLDFKFVTSLKYSKLNRFFTLFISLRNPRYDKESFNKRKICDEFHKHQASRDISSIEKWIFIKQLNIHILSKNNSQNFIKIKYWYLEMERFRIDTNKKKWKCRRH